MTVSSDRYELFESLGQSDCLTVYRAWDRQLRRFVAIMELDRRFRANELQYDAIWNEVLSFAAIEHYGLVRVYDDDKQHGWIVTELMNSTVASQISEVGLSNQQVRDILRTCLDALGSLHQRDKLHGDVRPSNMLIDDEGHVRLSHPVGLSIGGQIPRRKMNQKYLAPELVEPGFGEPGPATDLYCLGFTAYELLVGLGFDDRIIDTRDMSGTGNTLALSWLRWHASHDATLPPIKQIVPTVSEELGKLIDDLVAKPVNNRPQSAAEALRRIGKAEPEKVVFVNLADQNQSAQTSTLMPPHKHEAVKSRASHRISPYTVRARTSKTSDSKRSEPHITNPQRSNGTVLERILHSPWKFRCFATAVLCLAALIGIALQPDDKNPSPSPRPTPSPTPVVPWNPGIGGGGPGGETQLLEAIKGLADNIRVLKHSLEIANQKQDALIATFNKYTTWKPPLPPEPGDKPSKLSLVANAVEDGKRLLESGDLDGAIARLEQIRWEWPEHFDLWGDALIDAYSRRGHQLMETKQYSIARFYFDLSLNLAHFKYGEYLPKSVVRTALFGRGRAYLKVNLNEEALSDLDKVVVSCPGSSNALIQRGIVLMQMDCYEDAFRDFDTAVDLDSTSYAARNNRGVCNLRLGRFDEAVSDLSSAIEIDGSFANAHYNRHIAYYQLRESDLAEKDLERAREIEPHCGMVSLESTLQPVDNLTPPPEEQSPTAVPVTPAI